MNENSNALTAQNQDIASSQRKAIEALIDAVAVNRPTMRDLLTVAAIWQYLQLPDSSFGWSSGGAMPFQAKCLCVINSLDLGLVPGAGHFYWLGNRFYLSAAGARHVANTSSDFRFTGKRVLRKMTGEERAIFGVTDGDLDCVIEQPVRIRGEELIAVGYGIVGADELRGNKVWGTSRKNIAMNLLTRAERDLFNRYLPLRAASVEWDDPAAMQRALDEQQRLAGGGSEEQRQQQQRGAAPTTSSARPAPGQRPKSPEAVQLTNRLRSAPPPPPSAPVAGNAAARLAPQQQHDVVETTARPVVEVARLETPGAEPAPGEVERLDPADEPGDAAEPVPDTPAAAPDDEQPKKEAEPPPASAGGKHSSSSGADAEVEKAIEAHRVAAQPTNGIDKTRQMLATMLKDDMSEGLRMRLEMLYAKKSLRSSAYLTLPQMVRKARAGDVKALKEIDALIAEKP